MAESVTAAPLRYIDADSEFRAALAAKAQASSTDDEKTAVILNNLGATCEKLHQPREADALYRRAIAICEATLPAGHARTAHIRSKLKTLQVANCNDCNDCNDCNGCNDCNDCKKLKTLQVARRAPRRPPWACVTA